MIDDSIWSPGPCRAGQIREVLDRAALEKRALKIELGDAVVHFIGETAEVAGSSVIRVFDDKPTTDKQPPSEASCALRTSSMASSSARRATPHASSAFGGTQSRWSITPGALRGGAAGGAPVAQPERAPGVRGGAPRRQARRSAAPSASASMPSSA